MKTTGTKYPWFVLAMLTVMYCISVVHRQIIVVVQESIRQELHLKDAQLGLLSGLTFGLFYTVLAIPVARLADRKNRTHIIGASLIIYSSMTAVAAFAVNFLQLFLARVGVGIGEAGANPSAYSIISDIFPKEKRASAQSVYAAGAFLGIMVSYLAGGWLNHEYGWRTTLIIAGVPGILFAFFLLKTIREPTRTHAVLSTENRPGVRASMRYLLARKSYVYLCVAFGCIFFSFYGTNNWMPSLLARTHSMSPAQIGTYLSLSVGLSGLAGSLLGGVLADRYSKKDVRYYVWLPALANLIAAPFLFVVFFSDDVHLVNLAYTVPSFLSCMFVGTAIALIHRLVMPQIRAFASSIFLFVINICGISLAPLTVGWISDLLKPSLGASSLGWALLSTVVAALMGVVLLFRAAKYIRSDMDSAEN